MSATGKRFGEVMIAFIKAALTLFIIITLIISYMYYSNSIYEKGYESGYFHGWHESQFIDCSHPEINQTMEIVSYVNSTRFIHLRSKETVQGIKEMKLSYLKWSEVCERLNDSVAVEDEQ